MALTPIDEIHALQIQAGINGRKKGHEFEDTLTQQINSLFYPFNVPTSLIPHISISNPAHILLSYIAQKNNIHQITSAQALSTGILATSETGKKWLSVNGILISRCKSDLILTISSPNKIITVGVSIKQCNNATPTNAQLFFTTAQGFCNLLQKNNIPVSDNAIKALKQFCGDNGYQPVDNKRIIDPRRYFWEEIDLLGRDELENLFSSKQNEISRLLFQKAYLDDPFIPEYLLHKTKKSHSWDLTEIAIYSINKLVALSCNYQGFITKPYSIKKGSYKDPEGVQHLAPRFGIIQMQRGGQKQHPEQLQFNLEAGYFYKI